MPKQEEILNDFDVEEIVGSDENDVEEEFKASFGVNASVPSPIETGSTARPADKKDGEKQMPKLKETRHSMISSMMKAAYDMPKQDLAAAHAAMMEKMTKKNMDSVKAKPSYAMKEDLEVVFGDAELSEDFRVRAEALFEAAVSARVLEEKARMQEEFDASVEEQVQTLTDGLYEQTSSYFDSVVEQWMEQNQVGIDSNIRTEIAESFMEKLQALFVEHYIDIPEEKLEVVESLNQEIEEIKGSLNESINENLELQKQINELVRETVLNQVCEDLTDTQADKFRSLVESIDLEDVDSYTEKLNAVKENYIVEKKEVSAEDQLNEEFVGEEVKTGGLVEDPAISHYVDAIKRTART